MSFLASHYADANSGWNFLQRREIEARLKAPVHPPIMTAVDLSEPSYAIYAEKIIGEQA